MGPVHEGLARWKDRPAGRWRIITSARQADPMAGSYARDGEMMVTEKAERMEYRRRRG
ncbi:hypothetical protein L914_12949, partial [Phytophthora nicotianae]